MAGRESKTRKDWIMMAIAMILILALVGLVSIAFHMIQKRQNEKLTSVETQYEGEEDESEDTEIPSEQQTSDGADGADGAQAADTEGEVNSEDELGAEASVGESSDEKIYIIAGNDKGSNRYEKAAHLSYTSTERYTREQLSKLDAVGLKVTRNEIYARHGRIFNDQELQSYFEKQNWYVAQIAANDFDESCLNEVERDNILLIVELEQQEGSY